MFATILAKIRCEGYNLYTEDKKKGFNKKYERMKFRCLMPEVSEPEYESMILC